MCCTNEASFLLRTLLQLVGKRAGPPHQWVRHRLYYDLQVVKRAIRHGWRRLVVRGVSWLMSHYVIAMVAHRKQIQEVESSQRSLIILAAQLRLL